MSDRTPMTDGDYLTTQQQILTLSALVADSRGVTATQALKRLDLAMMEVKRNVHQLLEQLVVAKAAE